MYLSVGKATAYMFVSQGALGRVCVHACARAVWTDNTPHTERLHVYWIMSPSGARTAFMLLQHASTS